MSFSRRRRYGDQQINFWPGFVDALSTLLLAIVFLLSIFVLGQFFLGQELVGKETILERLQHQIAELTNVLSLEKKNKNDLEENIVFLKNTLQTNEEEKQKLQQHITDHKTSIIQLEKLKPAFELEKQVSSAALSKIDLLNQQLNSLRKQLSALEEVLTETEAKEKKNQAQISDLGQRLNVALAQRVQELAKYRSEFFGRLREILGQRPDIRVVGDRFVFQSEVFFDSGQAVLRREGEKELAKIATLVDELSRKIPSDISWVLRIDGHTDKRRLSGTGHHRNNWELSTARAIAVVQFLIKKGIPPQRLLAAGFAEFQPLETGNSEDAYRRNRRIELRLTER